MPLHYIFIAARQNDLAAVAAQYLKIGRPLFELRQFGRAAGKIAAYMAFLLGTVGGAHAQSNFEEDFDDQEKAWQEIAVQLPAMPQAENLLSFYVSPTATQSFAIDAKSLAIGSDGVIRYTLVTKSAEGAENISYEGIRCASFEKKLYAFGHQGDAWTWSRSRRDRWELISGNQTNRQHAALARDYFCQNLAISGTAKDILERIRWKRPLMQLDLIRP